MADDASLDNFFKSKNKAGGKKKKRGVQDVNALARTLERTVKEQEQIDRDKQEEERRQQRALNNAELNQPTQEDSDWHHYVAPTEVDLTAAGVKDMEFEEPKIEVPEDNEEVKDKKRTWEHLKEPKETSADNSDEEDSEKAPAPEPEKSTEPKAYVNPMMRRQIREGTTEPTKPPDLNDTTYFPSLGDADDIAKQQEMDRKKEEQRKKLEALRTLDSTAGPKPPPPHAPPTENAWQTAPMRRHATAAEPRQEAPQPYRAPRGERPPIVAQDAPQPAAPTAPSKYVPPHLRGASTANMFDPLKKA